MDPNDIEEKISDGSDDTPSEDNLDMPQLYKEVYLKENSMEADMNKYKEAEAKVKYEIKQMIFD